MRDESLVDPFAIVMVNEDELNVLKQAMEYRGYWRDKDDLFWWRRLNDEMQELAGVIRGTRYDSMEHELIQISSICMNWLDMIRNRNDSPKED